MLSIGAFAQIGQVTHRMLRHWDAAGLLVPVHTDPFSGYRSYDPSQLERLHRIVALRHLGFGIEDVRSLLSEGVDDRELAEMLSRRRAEVEQEHRIAESRLADVARRLHLIEKEKSMSTIEIIKKPLPTVRLAARTAVVSEQPEIADIVGPAFDGIAEIIGGTCGALETPIAAYQMVDDGTEVTVGYEYGGEAVEGFEIITLPAFDDAFVGVHLGSMSHIHQSWQALHEEILARGYAPAGPCRELYLRAESADQSDWVTELQQPVRKAE